MSDDLQADLTPDKFNLDKEWEKQPVLLADWLSGLPAAKAKVFLLEEELKLFKSDFKQTLSFLEADISAKIKKNPERFGIEKITIKDVSLAVEATKEYRKAYAEGVEKQRNLIKELSEQISIQEHGELCKKMFDHKKASLERLQDLFIQGYYSEVVKKKIPMKPIRKKGVKTNG